MSSKRSELAGMKGVRLVFQMCTKFNWKEARTEERLDEQKALKEKLMSKCTVKSLEPQLICHQCKVESPYSLPRL
jgi:hypothetical protein